MYHKYPIIHQCGIISYGGMFMFSKKNEKNNIDKAIDIPIMTIDYYPGREIEVLGCVTVQAVNSGFTKTLELDIVIPELQKKALELNADAIIGVRMIFTSHAAVYAYGTAIKLK